MTMKPLLKHLVKEETKYHVVLQLRMYVEMFPPLFSLVFCQRLITLIPHYLANSTIWIDSLRAIFDILRIVSVTCSVSCIDLVDPILQNFLDTITSEATQHALCNAKDSIVMFLSAYPQQAMSQLFGCPLLLKTLMSSKYAFPLRRAIANSSFLVAEIPSVPYLDTTIAVTGNGSIQIPSSRHHLQQHSTWFSTQIALNVPLTCGSDSIDTCTVQWLAHFHLLHEFILRGNFPLNTMSEHPQPETTISLFLLAKRFGVPMVMLECDYLLASWIAAQTMTNDVVRVLLDHASHMPLTLRVCKDLTIAWYRAIDCDHALLAQLLHTTSE